MIEREFDASLDMLPTVTSFIEEELEKLDCPMKAVMQIDIAAEELFVNIARYAYGDKQGKMQLIISGTEKSVTLQFKDSGTPFNPLAKEDPDINMNAEDRQIGGLGIYMVKKSMDNVEYEYKDGQNILSITKNF